MELAVRSLRDAGGGRRTEPIGAEPAEIAGDTSGRRTLRRARGRIHRPTEITFRMVNHMDYLKTISDGFDSLQEKIGGRLNELENRLDSMAAEKGRPNTGGGRGRTDLAHEIAKVFVENNGELLRDLERHGRVTFEVKTLTSANISVGVPIGPLEGGRNVFRLRGEIATYPAEAGAVFAIREQSFTNNAAPQAAEGDTKAVSNVVLAGETVPICTIAHTLSMSRQVRDDVQGLAAYLNATMQHGLSSAVEAGLLNGAGASGALFGIYQNGTNANTNLSGISALDSVCYIADEVEVAGHTPTHFIAHPSDIRKKLLTAKNNEASYLVGNVLSIPDPLMLWGLKCIPSIHMTSGKGLVCDMSKVHIREREGAVVSISESHSDDFVRNKLTLRVETRLASVIHQAGAFRKYTLPS